MGTPNPESPPFGDNCSLCEFILWNPGETPRFLRLTFSGLIKCPACDVDPPDGDYILEQDDVTPCKWELNVGVLNLVLTIDVGHTNIVVEGQGAIILWDLYFTEENPCETTTVNFLHSCLHNNGAREGTCDWEVVT